jgi:hypothetical protein
MQINISIVLAPLIPILHAPLAPSPMPTNRHLDRGE